MAREYTYFVDGPFGVQAGGTGAIHIFTNSHGDQASIMRRDGGYSVASPYYNGGGHASLAEAAHALIDASPAGRCDWSEEEI